MYQAINYVKFEYCKQDKTSKDKNGLFSEEIRVSKLLNKVVLLNAHCLFSFISTPVDLHWYFEIFIRTEKNFQLELKKIAVSLY